MKTYADGIGQTKIRTARASYYIVKVELIKGKLVILARSKPGNEGTTRALTRKDVTNVRWYAALSDHFRRQHVTA